MYFIYTENSRRVSGTVGEWGQLDVRTAGYQNSISKQISQLSHCLLEDFYTQDTFNHLQSDFQTQVWVQFSLEKEDKVLLTACQWRRWKLWRKRGSYCSSHVQDNKPALIISCGTSHPPLTEKTEQSHLYVLVIFPIAETQSLHP